MAVHTSAANVVVRAVFVLFIFVLLTSQQCCLVTAGSRLIMKGPVLTLTLKDPSSNNRKISSSAVDDDAEGEVSHQPIQSIQPTAAGHPLMNLESLRPHVLWSLQALSTTADDGDDFVSSSSSWMPSWWKSARATVGYEFEKLRRKPSFIEGDLKFRIPLRGIGNSGGGFHGLGGIGAFGTGSSSSRNWSSNSSSGRGRGSVVADAGGTRGSPGNFLDLQIQPSYEFSDETTVGGIHTGPTGGGRAECSILASTGTTAYLMAKFSTKRDRWLQLIRGCYQINFRNINSNKKDNALILSPSSLPPPTLSAVRITPTIDLNLGQASCLIEATTGSERTKAVLNLEYDNPTLTVVHSLDHRNTIAPQISLYNARILYQWDVALDSGTIRTKVDPLQAIHMTWTDRSMGGGKWVTDIHVPLVGTKTLSKLVADLRVRRQFSF